MALRRSLVVEFRRGGVVRMVVRRGSQKGRLRH